MGATGRGPDRERSQAASSAHQEVNKDRKAEKGSQEEESRSEPLGDAIYKQPQRALEITAGQQRPDSSGADELPGSSNQGWDETWGALRTPQQADGELEVADSE